MIYHHSIQEGRGFLLDSKQTTAAYRVISDAGGNRYRFFCDLSGALGCTTSPVRAGSPREELLLAWQEGRRHFNHCPRCGRWVCDAMYNADVLECVDCAPWEERPRFCCKCGTPISGPDTYCRQCGARLQYGEVWK